MKKIIGFVLTMFLIALAFTSIGQTEDVKYDYRIKAQLDNLGLKYNIKANGVFEVTVNLTEELERIVFIHSQTTENLGMELREINSFVMVFASFKPEKQFYIDLLEINAGLAIGSWQYCKMNFGENLHELRFVAKVSTNLSQSVLKELIVICAWMTFQMEDILKKDPTQWHDLLTESFL
jgi:hypothetical protein